MKLFCGNRVLDCSTPKILAVLNVTPDSFYDGGQLYRGGRLDLDAVLYRAEQLIAEGADAIDVGGESTRPGAAPVSSQQECDRVLPVVDALAQRLDTVISVDTSDPQVIADSARLGAGLINDVRALQKTGALEAAAKTGLPVCLMHMQGDPGTMQDRPTYSDPVAEVRDFLQQRRAACLAAGMAPDRIIVDPGIGFGKTDEHNLALLCQLSAFTDLGVLLVGVSRKSMFGRLLGRPPEARLAGSLATALIACQRGARLLRVHDVAATQDVVRMYQWIGQNLL